MKKLKKVLAVIMSMAMALTMCVGCDNGTDKIAEQTDVVGEDTGKEFVIYAWNDDWKKQFETFYQADFLKENPGITIKWVINTNEGGVYQQKLDAALLANSTAKPAEKVDLFLVEADYALKYANSPASIGLKQLKFDVDKDLKDQYKYTKDIVTDEKGNIKGSSWQVCPGLLCYRRDIAKTVLGVDQPADVQAYVKDWDTFAKTAETMKSKGYYMFSGYDDLYRTFSNNVSKPCVDDNLKIQIDPNIEKWTDLMKDFTDKGYHEKTSLWDKTWGAGMGKDGKVFCYFWSTWGINFCLNGFACEFSDQEQKLGNGTFGVWGACEGPQPYFWGGTWMMCATGSDNPNLVAKVMKKWTMDQKFMKDFTMKTQDMSNNKPAMEEIAKDSTYGAPVLAGQNHIALFVKTADKIKMDTSTAYDQAFTEEIQGAMKDYFAGAVTKDKAFENFYKKMSDRHSVLTH